MPILLAVLGAAIAAYVIFSRGRTAAATAADIVDMASDVAAAARRFGFTRRANVHPVETLDDPVVGVAAMGEAFLELDGLPTREQRTALLRALQTHLRIDLTEAEEAATLGRWLVDQSGGPAQGLGRIGRRLSQIGDGGTARALLAVVDDVASSAGGARSPAQLDALADLRRLTRSA
jgi:hypothetical protein